MKRFSLTVLMLLVAVTCRVGAEDEWRTTAAAYLWSAGIDGETAVIRDEPLDIDASATDIFEKLQFTLMGFIGFHNDDWLIFGEVFYWDLKVEDIDTPEDVYGDAEVDIRFGNLSLGASRRLRFEDFEIDPYISLRYWRLSVDLDLDAGTMPARGADDEKNWNDLSLGLRMQKPLSDRWFVSGWVSTNIEGDSDDFIDFFAGMNYRRSENREIIFGVRHQEVHYDSGDFRFDVELSGPLVGLIFRL